MDKVNTIISTESKYKKIRPYAMLGWAIQENNMTKEELDNLNGFNLNMLINDFEKWEET